MYDCDLELFKRNDFAGKVMLEVSARNEGSHFSQEDQGILPLSITMLIILVVFLGQAVWGYYQEHQRSLSWTHPLGILIPAILIEVIQLAALVLHYSMYAYNGYGCFPFYVISMVCQAISQTMVCWLLIMISHGWTISYADLEDTDVYVIIMCFAVMVNMFISALTFVDFGSHYKYHDYSGI